MTDTPTSTPKRRRGGQPGNRNALKHGFYSHNFTSREKSQLEQDILGEFQDEDKLINVFMDRVAASAQHEKLDFLSNVLALRAISIAIGRKIDIHRSKKDIYEKLTSIEKAFEELKDIPPEED
jgi:hypothetical protein